MRLRILVLVVLAALVGTSSATARSVRPHDGNRAHHAGILGTWSAQVTPDGGPPFQALVTVTRGGGLIETESDAPGTAQGAWKRTGPRRFAIAFQAFITNASGQPAGHVLVRSRLRLRHGKLSGPFKFDVYDASDTIVQSGTGHAVATRFVIPPF